MTAHHADTVRLREIVEAKRRTFLPLSDSYDEGFDDALCWVLDELQIDGGVPLCEAVVVKGKVLEAKCGHPLPCPTHNDGEEVRGG